jgi:hypothetical protein
MEVKIEQRKRQKQKVLENNMKGVRVLNRPAKTRVADRVEIEEKPKRIKAMWDWIKRQW